MTYPCTLAHVARVAALLIVASFFATPPAHAQRNNRVDELAKQLEEVQRELQTLRQRDDQRMQWEANILQRLPAANVDQVHSAPPGQGVDSVAANPDVDEEDDDEIQMILTPLKTDCGNVTFKPGARIQGRYVYDDANNDNDFFDRRFRLKASGDIFDLGRYGMELRLDSAGRFNTEQTPAAVVENAWLEFDVRDDAMRLRIGLYDAPFSRDALTSDSKLLFMDRSLINDALAIEGVTDNTVGMLFHGRLLNQRLMYAVGVFDDLDFEQAPPPAVIRNSNDLMTEGRVVWHLLDPAPAYAQDQASYIGKGRHLAFGVNGAFLSNVTDETFIAVGSRFDLIAWGVDVFFDSGPWVFQAEYDSLRQNVSSGNPDRRVNGWYAQAGYIIHDPRCCRPCNPVIELAARYQELDDRDGLFFRNDYIEETSVGVNFYFRDHNLKLQIDYTWRDERSVPLANDQIQMQLQFDY